MHCNTLCTSNTFNYFIHLRVQKDGTGHVYVQYKKLSTEEQWHPQSDERQLEIFKLDDVGCQMTPPGIPNQVHPYMAEEDIQTLMRFNNILILSVPDLTHYFEVD